MFPQKIGRYEIKSELGRGGMATVYRGYDPRFQREVAVKVLPREFLHDPSFRARFEREAQTIAALEHSAIVPVYDFGEEEGQPYLVMRLMTGGTLADRLEAGPLPLTEVARIFSRLAPALDRAHGKGIIHRDLKPGNVLFDDDDNPYISDFGIAKLTQASAAFTGSGIIGTPAYMSPEQARGEKDIDGRSDIYALGAILFQMLTGKFPYEADTPMGIVVKHITEPTPRILEAKPDLPPECETVFQQAMAKSRDERYATASGMAKALETIAQDTLVARKPAQPEAETTAIASQSAQAERERRAHEKAEAERIAALKAEEERIAREQADIREKAEQERLAREKAEAERLAALKAEEERLAQEKAEAERLAVLKAEEDRIAREKAEQERLARKKAEDERAAREKAERERLAREKAEQEKLAALKAAEKRFAAEKVEQERLAQEKAETERIDRQKVEGQQQQTAWPRWAWVIVGLVAIIVLGAIIMNSAGGQPIATQTSVALAVVSTDTPRPSTTPIPPTATMTSIPPTQTSAVTFTPTTTPIPPTKTRVPPTPIPPTISKRLVSVYSDNSTGNAEVIAEYSDGSKVNLTNNPATDGFSVGGLSPNSRRIAFSSNRDGNFEVYVISVDGSALVRLTNNLGWDGVPVWSPNGAQIAFVSDRDGNFEIYLMNTDGSNQVNLTQNPANDNGAIGWLPDGRISFYRDGTPFIMNPDGSNQGPYQP